MKKILLLLFTVIATLSFNACKSSQSATATTKNGGVSADDIAYVYFVSGGQYVGKKVDVKVDDYTNFDATPASSKSAAEAKGVAAGNRHMVVSSNGKTIFDGNIKVKTGDKKYIKLP